MNRLFVLTVVTLIAGCASHRGHVEVRPVESSASIAPSDALIKGEMLFQRGEYMLAIDAFRRAVRAAPEDARAYNGLGISYAVIGRHDLADRYLELALARAPGDGRVLRNLARSYASQGRVIEAKLLEDSTTTDRVGLVRPSLAELSARLSMTRAPIVTESEGNNPKLERVSLGEVLLRTSRQSRDRFGRRGTEVLVSAATSSTDVIANAPSVSDSSGGIAQAPQPDKRKVVFSRQVLVAASANVSTSTLRREPEREGVTTCLSERNRAARRIGAALCAAPEKHSAMRPAVQVVTTAHQMLIYTGSFKTVRLDGGRKINVPVIIHVALSKGTIMSSEQEASDVPVIPDAAQVSARAEGVTLRTAGQPG